MTRICFAAIVDLARCEKSDSESLAETATGEGPRQYCITFSRMNDMPIAVMSGARRGALRKRR